MSGGPIVFDGIEKSPTEWVPFRFGSMNENIDGALGDPDSHAAELGTIEVEILRVKVKRSILPLEQIPRAVATAPRRALDLSGRQYGRCYHPLLDPVKGSNALPCRRKKRSAPPVLDSLGFTYGADEKMEHARLSFLYRLAYQLQVLGCVHPVPADVPTAVASNSGLYTYTSKDFRMLSEKVDRVEEQLKESPQQRAALIEKLVGGIHSTVQSAPDVARSATSMSTPVQNSDVKRKRKPTKLLRSSRNIGLTRTAATITASD
ncbi:MAG: hypothetical protein Q9199_003685 [Rusavskia elegans]